MTLLGGIIWYAALLLMALCEVAGIVVAVLLVSGSIANPRDWLEDWLNRQIEQEKF